MRRPAPPHLLLSIGVLACLGTAAVHAQVPPAPATDPAASAAAQDAAERQVSNSPLGGCLRDTPAYPSASLRLEEQGRVLVLFKVDAQGRAGEATVHRSSGHEGLDAAALRHVAHCIRRHGQGEAPNLPSGVFQQPFEFRLE